MTCIYTNVRKSCFNFNCDVKNSFTVSYSFSINLIMLISITELKSSTNDRCHSFLLGSRTRGIFVGRFHIRSYLAEEVSHPVFKKSTWHYHFRKFTAHFIYVNSFFEKLNLLFWCIERLFRIHMPGSSAVNMKWWNFPIPFTGLKYRLKKASHLNHWNSPHLATVLLFADCSTTCSNCSMPSTSDLRYFFFSIPKQESHRHLV